MVLVAFQTSLQFDISTQCHDHPNITIDAAIKLPGTNGQFYIFYNEWIFKIDGITKTGLPVISDGYPRLIKDEWSTLNISKVDAAFTYENTVYLIKVK